MSQGIKFIRVNGRIVPIKEKTYSGKKTVERDIKTRVVSGAKTGAKIGAGIGATTGLAVGMFSPVSTLKMTKMIGIGTLKAGAALGVAGAVLGGVFGKRKGQKTVKKKKYTSV